MFILEPACIECGVLVAYRRVKLDLRARMYRTLAAGTLANFI